MTDKRTTLAFITAALVIVLLTWFTRPAPYSTSIDVDVGGKLFPEFHDPLEAKSIEIAQYEEPQGFEDFKVANTKGVWTIPSHSDYPADAEKQLERAAASVIDIKKLAVVSTSPSEHATYGVIDPDPEKLTVGTTGVGKRVVLKNAGGRELASFIIGTSPEGQSNLRYVRIPGEDPVYQVEMQTDQLSTRFGDWIEKDLLKLKAFDLKQVTMNDYSVDESRGAIIQRGRYTVGYDTRESKWSLDDLEVYGGSGWKKETAPEGDVLNTQKLNDLKSALDDLKIVDVVRKPPGLSANLRAGEALSKDVGVMVELQRRGFFIAPIDGVPQLISNEGDVHCGTIEGVEYVLRFGEITSRGGKDDEKEKDAKEGEGDSDGGGQNRYIMVSVEFNKDLIPKPEIVDLPEPAAEEAKDKEDEKTDEKKADDEKKPDEVAKSAEGEDKNEKADEKKPEPPKKSAFDPARAAIEKENQRRLDEYNSKVKKGEEKVKELNDRFAEWYYVISDATYQKIHLPQSELFKKPGDDAKKPDAPPADSLEEFDRLKNQGLPK